MHTHQYFTWTTHTAETTTLLDYKKLYTYMCNIVTELVTEFYLYSIVYLYLINSRLDVTHSVRHHFRISNSISHRNILLATDKMIDILSKLKHWFIDATFKVVRWPFTQPHNTHAFIKAGNYLKLNDCTRHH